MNSPAWSIKDFAERLGVTPQCLRLRMSRSKYPVPAPVMKTIKGSGRSATKLYTTSEFWKWWEAETREHPHQMSQV